MSMHGPIYPVLALGLCAPLLFSGCGSDGTGPSPDPDPDPTGGIRVTAATSGPRPDPDGYTVSLGSFERAIEVNGTTVFRELETGSHTVELAGLSENCTVSGESSVPVTVQAGAIAEVVFEVDCGWFVSAECPALALETTSGAPLSEVAMGSLPTTFEFPVAASVSLDGSSHEGFAFIRSDDPESHGNPRILVPLHPASPMEGGSVTLTVSDGTRACGPVDFTIDPLPPAEGESEAIVDLLQELLGRQASQFATTPEELVSTPMEELPRGVWPLALAQGLLDDPANDRSLRAVVEGSQGSEVVVWLDRLLARTELRSSLESLSGASGGPEALPRPDASATRCLPEFVNGSDASVLDECMTAAAEARRRAEGIAQKVADQIGDVMSVASQLELPVAGIVEAVLSSVFWVIQSEREKAAALYPSRFTQMNLEVSRQEFAEDEDDEGRVSRAEVYATSEGFDLLQEIVDGITQALSLAQSTGEFDISTDTPVDDAVGELQSAIEQRIREMELEDFDIPPELFGPVDVTDPQWIQARVATGNSIEMAGDLGYEPVLWGSAVLSVRTFDGKFGGEQIAEQAEVTIPPIQMIITPKDTAVKASDPENPEFVTFQVEVLESISPDSVDLDLDEHPRQGLAEIRISPGGSVHEVDYLAPSEPDFDGEDLIVVRHIGRSGARANGPPRTATATVRFGSITLSPRNPCVEPGETADPLQVEVQGLQDESVTWWASHGDIDENGAFTAPTEPPPGRDVTIRATSVAQPEISDEITAQVGACDLCRYDLTLSGGVSGVGQGPAGFASDEGYLELVLDGDRVPDTPGDRIHSGFDVTWDGETGTYPVTYGNVANRTSGGWALYDPGDPVADCETCGGTVTIEEVTEEVMVGRLDVTLSTISPDPDLSPTTAIGTFRASLITPNSLDLDAFRQCVIDWR